jgi:hypothetical protein
MKMLYANGDSWTFGEEFPSSTPMDEVNRYYTIWPYVLSTLMNIPLVVNEAMGGGSNHRIFRKTIDFIFDYIGKKKNPNELLIVIGWTTPERSEIYVNDRYCKITSNGVVEKNYPTSLDDYQRLYYDFYDDGEAKLTQLRYMLILRQICDSFGIKYYDFIAIGEQPLEYNILSLKHYGMSLNRTYGRMSWKKFVYLNNLPTYEYGHPTIATHEIWANEIYKDLK